MKTLILPWETVFGRCSNAEFEQDMFNVNEGHTIDYRCYVDDDSLLNDEDRVFFYYDDGIDAGIAMVGHVNGESNEDEEGNTYYEIDPLVIINPQVSDILGISDLEVSEGFKEFYEGSKVNWGNYPALENDDIAKIEELWLEHLIHNSDKMDGVHMAKSWQFDFSHFETIPPLLQTRLSSLYGTTCCRCGATQGDTHEIAYHVEPEKFSADGKLKDFVACYCEECWFSADRYNL